MLNKEKAHEVFGEIWTMFNNVRRDNSDEGWSRCVEEADRIHLENPDNLYEKILLAVVDEAEAEAKVQDTDERHARYKAAANAYQAVWKLFERLLNCLDVNSVVAYNQQFTGAFATKLSSAVYEAACGGMKQKGSFAHDAYSFYEKFKNGISDEQTSDAYMQAECIIEMHPEYMLQMMDMYDDLRKRYIANTNTKVANVA